MILFFLKTVVLILFITSCPLAFSLDYCESLKKEEADGYEYDKKVIEKEVSISVKAERIRFKSLIRSLYARLGSKSSTSSQYMHYYELELKAHNSTIKTIKDKYKMQIASLEQYHASRQKKIESECKTFYKRQKTS